MKQVLFSILFISAFAFSSFGQAQLYAGKMGPDTVRATQTLYQYPSATTGAVHSFSSSAVRRFSNHGDFELLTQVDSLAGTPSIALTLEVAYDLAATLWYPVQTTTYTNMGPTHSKQFHYEDTDFCPTWARVKSVSAGSDTTQVRTVFTFKKKL